MNTAKRIEYDDGRVQASLLVAKATVRMGMERQLIKQRTRQESSGDQAVDLLRFFTWPDIASATVEGEIVVNGETTPAVLLSFEEWLELPEPLAVQWERAVYDLNPHWLPNQGKKETRRTGNDGATPSESASSSGPKSDEPPEITQST